MGEKKQLRLTKTGRAGSNGYNGYSQNNIQQRPGGYGGSGYSNPSGQRPAVSNNIGRNGRIINHPIDGGYDNNVIHSRLLDLLDPAKHMHPGIPYDFYSGYILMVAKNVDRDHEDESSSGSRYGQSQYRTGGQRQQEVKESVHLYGRLSDETVSDLRRNYGGFNRVSNEKYRIVMNPVDVLNLLGQHGYRVIGFTAESDQKMVWTLEQKDFEQLAEGHNTIHH